MTRINTNISSLTAQNALARSNLDLQEALTRLSTGLRINTGKDDPAGLIASEALRSDIISVQAAISNTERANQMISTADSALGQISSLLNDIRGLVTEAANSGAMSDEQIAANQLQVDSSLEAINRIAQVTSFQGRRLLDGTLDFTTATWTGDEAKVSDLKIEQANLGTSGDLTVTVEVATAATKGSISGATGGAGTEATATVNFIESDGSSASITLEAPGQGTGYNNVRIEFVEDADTALDAPTAEYDAGAKRLTVYVADSGNTTMANIQAAIERDTDWTVSASDGANYAAGLNIPEGQQAWTDITFNDGSVLRLTAASLIGTAGNITFNAAETATGNGTHEAPIIAWNGGTGELDITLDEDTDTTMAELVAAFNADGTFSAQLIHGTSAGIYDVANDDVSLFAGPTNGYDAVTGTTAGGTGSGDLLGDVVFQLTGSRGSQVFSFNLGTTAAQIANAINAVSDAIGVTAVDAGANLTFNSTTYGSDGLVQIGMISDDDGTFTTNLDRTRHSGSDIVGTISGVAAKGDGSTLSVNMGGLTMSITFDSTSADGDSVQFHVNGGGALFQLGPDVNTAQQARIGIFSVNTGRLGGTSGRLYQLGSGEEAALDTDATTAAEIVDEVIAKVASLRGRLGAFQKATLESNINSLKDTLENLTDAESSIRDADFAAETANLTRAQILVQSGVSVLAIANSNPQNILALLR